MKYFSRIPGFLYVYLLCFGCLVGCSSGQETGTADEPGTVSEDTSSSALDGSTLLADQFFSAEAINALNEIKAVFDQRISKGYGDRPPAYVYEQHALRMRMDYFDNDPYTSVFPYNGEFDLSDLREAVKKLPFVTQKCGFQNPATKEVVNYYCFNTNPEFMQYLTKVGENSGLIKGFQQRYQDVKSIDPAMREAMLTQSVEEIDFANLDQQYFYMMFHILVNEERLALEKLKAQLK